MHILALETSQLPGSIHLAEAHPGRYSSHGDLTLPDRQSTAQCFAPRIREMLHASGIGPRSIGLVAVDVGPGSFTGLRIAVTFAKTFAYATGADVLGISSMDILAYQAAEAAEAVRAAGRRLWTAVDAHRGQVFAACYEVAPDGSVRQTVETQLIDTDRWAADLQAKDIVTGPVVERLGSRLSASVQVAPVAVRVPAAEWLARIAWRRWQDGERGDLWRLSPNYIRRSAAEEKLDAAPS